MVVLVACIGCDSDQISLEDYHYVLKGEEGSEMVMMETWTCKVCNKKMMVRDGELL